MFTPEDILDKVQ